jgi:hypothetical protein
MLKKLASLKKSHRGSVSDSFSGFSPSRRLAIPAKRPNAAVPNPADNAGMTTPVHILSTEPN